MGTVAEIWRYPVKSMAGERLRSCIVTETGLEGDRRWALIDGHASREGKPLTIRQAERLMTYRARLAGGRVEVVSSTGDARDLDRSFVSDLSREIGRPLSFRDQAGANFDDSLVLLVNVATVAAFALDAGVHVDHRRFRANLYLDNLEAGRELRWLGRHVHAGVAKLEVTHRCERCVVITRDPDTTAASPELLRVLVEDHEQCMGVYCRVVRRGLVTEGDYCGPV